jgi:hypothetical protein
MPPITSITILISGSLTIEFKSVVIIEGLIPSRAAPVTFGQGPDSRTVISDDEVLSGPESYGSHHPEQDGEIDEIDLSTWSVPSWEDLIASLYKP